MYRQYSSRIQRKRGIKVKHALRICVLVAVCFWLIYQVKHFHEDSDAKGSMHGGSSGGLIKIRRKDLRSLYHGNLTENKHHNQATEEGETTEAVENNLEEVSSTDKKVEEEDEALGDGDGDGDGETDEHEVKKLDTKVGQEEDGVDSAAEGEITDDGNGGWQENFVEDGDRGAKSYSEAREEFYNADEASSAVTRDNHTQTTENEGEVAGITDPHHEKILEQESKENPGKEAYTGEMKKRLEVYGGGKSEDTNPSSATDIAKNVTTSEIKENNLDIPEKDSSQNNTLTESHNATLEASNNTTDVSVTTQNPKLSEQNVTRSRSELSHDQIIVTKGTSTEGSNIQAIITLELANNSTLDVEDNQSDSNSTAAKNSESDFEDFSEPSNNTDSLTFRSNHPQLEDGTNTRKKDIVSAESVTSNGTDEVHTVSTELSDIQSSDSSLR